MKKVVIEIGLITIVIFSILLIPSISIIYKLVIALCLSIFLRMSYLILSLDKTEFKIWYNLIKCRNKTIRLSISYLIKIKVDNKYLLVKGKHNKFQPIGGAYKFYPSSQTFRQDNCIFHDKTSSETDDMRINIPKKNVMKFIKWFNSNHDFEYGINREFVEEMSDAGIYDSEVFKSLNYQYLGCYISNIKETTRHKKLGVTKELLISRIFQIELLPNQEKYLETRMNEDTDKFVFVMQSDISNLDKNDFRNKSTISQHSKLLVDGNKYVW